MYSLRMSASDQHDRQRLKQAKVEFEALLRKLLPECARGRSGLFGQHAKAVGKEVAARYYAWPEADKLFVLSEEISNLQEKVGDTRDSLLLDAYLGYRAETGATLPSEPKLALRFLQELKRQEFEKQGRPTNIERYAETMDEDDIEMSEEE
jgi:hypothetical protein